MGPHSSSVVLSLAGRGPVTALTSVRNGAPLRVGGFEFCAMGSCPSTDLSAQWSPIESWLCLSASDGSCNGAPLRVGRCDFGVMGSCLSTDLSVHRSPIESQSLLIRSDGVLSQRVQWGPISVGLCTVEREWALLQH